MKDISCSYLFWKFIVALAEMFFGEKNLAVLQELLDNTWALNFLIFQKKSTIVHATFIVLSKYLPNI